MNSSVIGDSRPSPRAIRDRAITSTAGIAEAVIMPTIMTAHMANVSHTSFSVQAMAMPIFAMASMSAIETDI